MINLMHAKLYELRKSMTFKVSLLVTTLCAVILAVLSNGVALGKLDVTADTASGLTDAFIISVIGSLIAGNIICSDFDNKNIHDEISRGRKAIVTSKVIIYCLVISILVLPYALVGFIGFLAQGSFSPNFNFSTYTMLMSNPQGFSITGDNIGKAILVLLVSIVLHVARLSICIPIAFKVRKSVVVTVIGVVFLFVVDFFMVMVAKISALADVVELLPYGKAVLTMDMSTGTLIKYVISSLVFINIMRVITYVGFKKSEIK